MKIRIIELANTFVITNAETGADLTQCAKEDLTEVMEVNGYEIAPIVLRGFKS